METMGLANLIAEEIQSRTINALLVTPVRTGELMTAKGISGVGLAFIQVVFFMAVVGGLKFGASVTLAALFLGCLLVTGIGFIIGSVAKDFMSISAIGMPALMILFIPSFGVLFPGAFTGWIKAIPSYYLVDTVHRVSGFGAGWGDVWRNLVILLAFDIGSLLLGSVILKRRMS